MRRIDAGLWKAHTVLFEAELVKCIEAELVKCILLCKNCHYELHEDAKAEENGDVYSS